MPSHNSKSLRRLAPTALAALNEQLRLLRIEYEEEKKAFTEVVDKIGLVRLEQRGDAWSHVEIEACRINSLNRNVVDLLRLDEEGNRITTDPNRTDENEKDHNFEYGKPVMIFSTDEDGKIIRTVNGTVSYVVENRMVVEIPDSATLPSRHDNSHTGVMISFDETSYRVMFDALERTISAKGRLGELRDLVYSNRKCDELSFAALRFPYLNASQQSGVNKVLAAKDVAIVHGPPGTGKTTTLVEAIYETLRRESQTLVCAQSNSAVDLICERLMDRGVSVLRIGNPSRVNDKMLSFTYERKFEAHPDYPTLWAIRKSIRELRTVRRHSDQWHQKMDRLKSRAVELEVRINNDLFGEARVIACTLVGSANRLLDGMKFPTLFIDEAAQALEAACWIPMRRAGRMVLAGDHCQLPPTVKSYEAQKQGLGRSLMERIVDLHPEAVVLLGMQYRMNEQIMRFSSDWFYHGGMTAAPEVRDRGVLDLDIPIAWIDSSLRENDTDGGSDAEQEFYEQLAGESSGRINADEAILSLQTLQNYMEKIGLQRILDERIDFAVISPYRAQTRYLRSLIKQTPFFKPVRKLITVNTVDGFQGRERDVVLISLVRSNDKGNIGFLRDLRRMNVAMTRARMKLIIIGDSRTLTRHPFYRKLYEYIRSL